MISRNKLSLKDVARQAGVSLASVSRVARGQANVDPAIREQVRRAAEELGVDLDRKHRQGSSMVGFILGNRDVLHSFQARVSVGRGAILFLAERRSRCSSRFAIRPPRLPKELHIPQILTQPSPVRAVILGGTNSANMIDALRERKIPFAVLGNNVVGPWNPAEHDCVYSDDIQGAFDLTNQLISDGHRHIWFIGDTDLPWFERCGQGYRQAMEQKRAANTVQRDPF